MKSIKYSKLVCALMLSSQLSLFAAFSLGDNIRKAINNPQASLEKVTQGLQTAASAVERTDAALDQVKMAVLTTLDGIDNLATISTTSGLNVYNNAIAIGSADSAKEVIDPLFGMINAPLNVYDRALTVLTDLTNMLDTLSKNLIKPVDTAAHNKVIMLTQDIAQINSRMQDVSRKLHEAFPLIQSHAHKLNERASNMVRYVKESPLNR